MVIDNVRLDLGNVTVPVYNLATREDHIAPAKSAFLGSKFFGGPVKYVLAGSGHIAGVVNPPGKPKYQYWTGDAPVGNLDRWIDEGDRASGLVVAGLDRVDQGAGRRDRAGARARRRQAHADRGRAGKLREGERLALA